MKLKVSLATALFISLFLVGSILIFGYVENRNYLIATYFIFTLFTLVLVAYSLKENFNKKDILFVFIALLLIAGFAAYSAEAAKRYTDNNLILAEQNADLVAQLDSIELSNQDSLAYIDYLRSEIIRVHSDSLTIQSEIDSLTNLIQTQETVTQPPIIIYHEDDEREEEDD